MKIEIIIKPKTRRPQKIKKAECAWTISAVLDDGKKKDIDGTVSIPNASIKTAALIALRDALGRFNKPAVIKLYIHEDFTRAMLSGGMLQRWERNDWRKIRRNEELKHRDLWMEIAAMLKTHAVSIAKKEEMES